MEQPQCEACRARPATARLPIEWMPAGFAAVCNECNGDPKAAVDLLSPRAWYDAPAARFELVKRAERRYPYALEDAGETRHPPHMVYCAADETVFVLSGREDGLWKFRLLPALAETGRRARRKRRTTVPKRRAAAKKEESDDAE